VFNPYLIRQSFSGTLVNPLHRRSLRITLTIIKVTLTALNYFIIIRLAHKNFKNSHLNFKQCFMFLLYFSTIFHHLPIYRTKDTIIHFPFPRITLIHHPFYSLLPPLVPASLPSRASNLIWTILVWELIRKFENMLSNLVIN
jgi:hypothetical protein